MYWVFALAILAILRCSTANLTIRGNAQLDPHTWTLADGTEAFKLLITVKMQYPVPNGWRMALIFTQPIKKMEVWRAKVINTSADMKTHALKNMDFNPRLAMGEDLTMVVVAYNVNKGSKPGKITVLFRGGNVIPSLPTLPPPTAPPEQIQMYQLKPMDENDNGFKMILKYDVLTAVKNWRISLKFTKNISTHQFTIDKAKVAFQKKRTSNSFCLIPRPYNENMPAKSLLQLQFRCDKAKRYEAAPNAYFVFHPNSTKCEDFDLPTPAPGSVVPKEKPAMLLTEQWPPNNFKMRFDIQVINSVRGGWKITLKFSIPVAEISSVNAAKVAGKSKNKRTYYLENFPGQIQNANLKQCEKIKIEFAGRLVKSAAISDEKLTASVSFGRKEPEYSEINPQGACPPGSR